MGFGYRRRNAGTLDFDPDLLISVLSYDTKRVDHMKDSKPVKRRLPFGVLINICNYPLQSMSEVSPPQVDHQGYAGALS